MSKRGEARSIAADVYQRVREDIFDGALTPGQRLQPSVLSQLYGASTTVVREALTALVGDKLVTSRPGQGFFVPSPDPDELRGLTTLRCHNESLALRLAIEHGGVEWEAELMAAHHRLAQTPRREPDEPDHVSPRWLVAHRAFHNALIQACTIPMLIDLCDQLSSSAELYRVWSGPVSRMTSRDIDGEHQAILTAALSHDSDRAVELLTAHYEMTATLLLEHWPDSQVIAADVKSARTL